MGPFGTWSATSASHPLVSRLVSRRCPSIVPAGVPTVDAVSLHWFPSATVSCGPPLKKRTGFVIACRCARMVVRGCAVIFASSSTVPGSPLPQHPYLPNSVFEHDVQFEGAASVASNAPPRLGLLKPSPKKAEAAQGLGVSDKDLPS